MNLRRKMQQLGAGISFMAAGMGAAEAAPPGDAHQGNDPTIEVKSASAEEVFLDTFMQEQGSKVAPLLREKFREAAQRFIDKSKQDTGYTLDNASFRYNITKQLELQAEKFREKPIITTQQKFVEGSINIDPSIHLDASPDFSSAQRQGEYLVGENFIATVIERKDGKIAGSLERSTAGVRLRNKLLQEGWRTNNQIQTTQVDGLLYAYVAVQK